MTTSTHETEIIVDPKVPLVRFIREFDAPADKVFRAHVDPELIVQWLGPRRQHMRVETWDCRNGGEYRYVHESDGNQYWFRGCFHEIRPGELLVQTFTYEAMPDGVALERMTFEDIGNGRSRLVATSLVDSFEDRDAFVSSGVEVGAREGYEKLDELLAR
jgi:uncharacterized protein YndB with AHSA1/START domain